MCHSKCTRPGYHTDFPSSFRKRHRGGVHDIFMGIPYVLSEEQNPPAFLYTAGIFPTVSKGFIIGIMNISFRRLLQIILKSVGVVFTTSTVETGSLKAGAR
jgi:hypothetical protein